MPKYNFKKEAKVYIVNATSRYELKVGEISFSQTFEEHSYPTKTLHSQSNVFEASTISKASVANFEFSFPLVVEERCKNAFFNHLLNVTTFDLYITTEADTFKLKDAVITNGTFVIEKSRPLSIDLKGEASKLSRGASLPTTDDDISPDDAGSTTTYIRHKTEVILNDVTKSDISSVSIELQNNIEWNGYTTLHKSLDAVDASTSMYPSGFTLSKKILSGSISQILTDATANVADTLDWDTNAELTIKAGNGEAGNSFRGLFLDSAICSFTNRTTIGEIFFQNYDWRVSQNPTSLAATLKYITTT